LLLLPNFCTFTTKTAHKNKLAATNPGISQPIHLTDYLSLRLAMCVCLIQQLIHLTIFYTYLQGMACKAQQLTYDKYNKVSSNVRQDAEKLRKVLSSVVMVTENSGKKDKDFMVVAIGTGTKCISHDYLDEDGLAVNDCHAEIVARRAFVRFLYAQLHLCAEGKEKDSIFKKTQSGKYKLQSCTSFLLYISKAPCGAASVRDKGASQYPNTRAKIESRCGTSPVCETPQTWEDLKNGKENLLTMSCSDKIARWNVLGTQGSLLSLYIDPIYFKSIIIGSAFNEEHLKCATNQRVIAISDLPEPHKVNQFLVLPVSEPYVESNRKPHCCSLNWSLGDEDAEVVKCKTGKQHITKSETSPSRICKKFLFKSFLSLWDQVASEGSKQAALQQLNLPLDNAQQVTAEQLQCTSYRKVKGLAEAYQNAKQRLFDHFVQQSYGYWAKKPPEQDDFHL